MTFSNIIINHKEVKSLSSSNNGVVYDKGTVNPIGSFTLESSEDILSYNRVNNLSYNPSSCIFKATVLDINDNPIEGEYVLFINSNGEYIDTFTDENGEAEYEYTSCGVGDVEVIAKCRTLTKTYKVKDAYFYDSLLINKNQYNVTSGSISLTYDNNGLTAKGNVLSDSFATRNDLTLPSTDYKVSYVLSDFTYGTGEGVTEIGFEDVTVSQTANGIYLRRFGGGTTSTTTSATTGDVISLEITGTTSKTVKLYVNDELRTILTDVAQTGTHRLKTYQNRSTTFKDLIIEPLQSISVNVDNPILSYADEDTATLTATVNPIAQGKTVKIYKYDTLIATEQTDEYGQVTTSYTSQGVGDVEFTFECGALTETFVIRDYYLNDSGETDNRSKYSGTLSLGYDSTNHYYTIPSNATAQQYAYRDLIIREPLEISFDYNTPTNKNVQIYIHLIDTENDSYKYALFLHDLLRLGARKNGTNLTAQPLSHTSTYNQWFSAKIKLYPNNLIAEVYDTQGNLKWSKSYDYGFTTTYDRFRIQVDKAENQPIYFKNIQIKPIQSIDISVDNPILSYADHSQTPQIATMTATVPTHLIGNSVKIYKDDVLLDTLSTDSQGQVEYTYTSQGVGDVEFEFVCGSVTGTTTIEDIFYYNPLTEDRGSYNNTSNLNITYSANGMKVLGTKSSDVYTKNTDITLPNHYSIEMTVTEFNSGWNTDICVETMFFNNAQNGTIRRFSNMTYDDSKGFGSYSVGTVVKFVYDASTQTLQLYYDGVLKKTMTSLPSNHIQQFKTYTGRYLTVKDLKVREL